MILKEPARQALARLAADPSLGSLDKRTAYWLQLLESNPGSAEVRRNRLQPPGVWVIRMPAPIGADWIILWTQENTDTVVHYIGPASFA
jgi:hypothetical protein